MMGAKHLIGFAAIAALAGCKLATTPDNQSVSAANTTAPAPIASPTLSPAAAYWAPEGSPPQANPSLAVLPTQPGDIPDSHDVAFLKRFQGASIIGYVARPYDTLSFYDSSSGTNDEHHLPIEGQVTRIVYRVPKGHSALEVERNYQDLVKAAGLAQTSERPCASVFGGPAPVMYDQIPTGKLDNPAYVGGTGPDMEMPYCYFTARANVGGRPLMVAVLTAEKHKYLKQTGFDGTPINYTDGETVVILDMVVGKAVDNQMVTVKASDMADALASKGFIDLYGVYFDTDQSAVKPDSKATLDEMASLLKIDRSLRIEVSGHTDSNGSKDHNLSLSSARATAVVQALVSQYGIDPKRLVAKGYGDSKPLAPNDSAANMAKNRRVELRKI